MMTTTFVSRASRGHRRFAATSPTIANPSPPTTIRTLSVSSTSQSLPKVARLRESPTRSKPALLNAVMAWKTPHQGASEPTPRRKNAIVSTIAPAASTIRVKIATRRTSDSTPPRLAAPVASWTRTRSRSPVRRPMARRAGAWSSVMNPNPPTWMSTRMTSWPKPLQ